MAFNSQPFIDMGWTNIGGDEWVPADHPAAKKAGATSALAGGAAPQGQAANPGASPWGNYPGRSASTNAPAYSYTPQTEIQAQRQSSVSRMLTNPYTMGPEQTSQLKEKGKEEAVGLEQQLATSMRENAAARGLSSRGGYVNAQETRLADARNRDITSSNREIDLRKMGQDRTDELQALAASGDFMQQDQQQALNNYQAQLAGAGQNLAGHNSDLGAYFQWLDSQRGDQALDLQGELGRGGLSLDQQRLGEGGRQFDLSHALALMQFMENQRQFGMGYGLDLTRLGQTGQQNTVSGLF